MDKKLRVPRTDLKKKPHYELLIKIGKNAVQEITPHPFTKLKPPKKEKIEEIFIKGGGEKDSAEKPKKVVKKKKKLKNKK